jgi:glycosyltransferase involved in cell wall biosynthesis
MRPFLEPARARAQLGIPPDRKTIGFVGRLTPEKGADLFLDALARLPGTIAGVIVGDGPERAVLEARCDRLGLRSRLLFAGARPDAGELVSAFDAVVVSSRTEGSPMILLEAISAGVPVVAARVGGVPDVLGERGGWLVPPAAPEAIAAAVLERFALESEARARVAEAQVRSRRDFGLDTWLSRYEHVYATASACVRGRAP